jgi:hypothetical protein
MQNEQTELALNTNSDETKVTPINDVEWCYQFFENEPVVFGFCKEEGNPTPLTIELRPVEEDVLAFNYNGMIFKIFPRPISEDTKKYRAEQNEKQNENEG